VFLRGTTKLKKEEPRLKSEEKTRYHICKGTNNDERQCGTICSANSGKGSANSCTNSQTNYKSTTNDNSIGKTVEGAKVGVPQMTSPHEKQLREHRQEVPQMTFPQEKQLKEYN
jgi:hypothetical protein